jgi:uncharacterized protein
MKISPECEDGSASARSARLLSTAPPQAAGRRVLLVDEITTSGDTLRLALAALRDVGPAEIRTATCFCRPGRLHSRLPRPRHRRPIVFPWDRQIIEDGPVRRHPTIQGRIEEDTVNSVDG